MASLAEWAKRIPLFTTLCLTDQVKLLQWNWAELLIGGFCYRSSAVSDGILLATGLHLSRQNLQKAGVGTIVNRLFGEVINKMQKLQIDVAEWGCLRAIMLFAPGNSLVVTHFLDVATVTGGECGVEFLEKRLSPILTLLII